MKLFINFKKIGVFMNGLSFSRGSCVFYPHIHVFPFLSINEIARTATVSKIFHHFQRSESPLWSILYKHYEGKGEVRKVTNIAQKETLIRQLGTFAFEYGHYIPKLKNIIVKNCTDLSKINSAILKLEDYFPPKYIINYKQQYKDFFTYRLKMCGEIYRRSVIEICNSIFFYSHPSIIKVKTERPIDTMKFIESRQNMDFHLFRDSAKRLNNKEITNVLQTTRCKIKQEAYRLFLLEREYYLNYSIKRIDDPLSYPNFDINDPSFYSDDNQSRTDDIYALIDLFLDFYGYET